MSEDIVNISFESLFEMLRRERNRNELQSLPSNFFINLVDYINAKRQLLENSANDDSMLLDERQKLEMQIGNTKKMIKDLYERRETKILSLATNKVKVGADLIDTSAMLDEEKIMFEQTCLLLQRFRSDILLNVMNYRVPHFKSDICQTTLLTACAGPNGVITNGEGIVQPVVDENKLVRFLFPVPKFVDKDLKVYGPFDVEDMASLPKNLATVLVSKGRAEEVRQNF